MKIHRQPREYIASIVEDLKDTAEEHNAAGLAAPQIGLPFRIIVVRLNGRYYHSINPEITLKAGREVGEEGCLSFPPQLRLQIARASRIKWRDHSGNGNAIGMVARAFQHEVDHLDGVLIIDKEDGIGSPQESSTDQEDAS